MLKEEEAYKAVEKNLSGSRPRELFDDVVEDAEKEFEKDRSLLKVCSRRFFFQMEETSIAKLLIHDECPRRRRQ